MTDPFHHEKRKPLTPLQRAKLFAERGGICGGRGRGGCGKKIAVGEAWIDEHVHALSRGGSNAWDNRELRCEFCATEKTKVDLKASAKSKRVYAKHVGAKKPKSALSKKPGFTYDWNQRRYIKDE